MTSCIFQDLHKSCERLRPSLFRLASDTVDDDEALTQILAANDELTLAVNAYKERTGGRECNRRSESEEAATPKNKSEPTQMSHLLMSFFFFLFFSDRMTECSYCSSHKSPRDQELPPHRPLGSGLSSDGQESRLAFVVRLLLACLLLF